MSDLDKAVQAGSRSATIWGIAVLIFGILAMVMPFVTGIAITIAIGIILVAAGIAQLVFAFQSDSFGKGALRFGFGLLTALCGVVMMVQPDAGLATITLILAVWFFVDGFFSILSGFSWKPEPGWGWMVFNGVVGIILGVMIYRQFPTSALWLVGVLVGVRLILAGWTMIALGSMGRAVGKKIAEAGD